MPTKRAPVNSDGRKDRLAGKTIADRYVIESLIARGGMAAVYRAHQVKLNRRIAIKILRPPPDSDENASFHERFRLEAETLAQLNHPNIVTVYDHGDFDDDQVFLAMEFVNGKRLTDLLRDGPLTVERTLQLLMQVCEALRYAHRRGVVHRDLKPSNLLITETDDGDEHVKVVDFGLVKLTEVDVTITSNGLILGSPHCMAPEQVRGQQVDARTDIYALGVLLFRCLTGTYPFHGNNSTATMIAHLNQPTPTFFSASPDLEVPDGLENVVRRCLSKNPKERFQSMEELQEALGFFISVSPDQYRTVSRSQATLERYVPELNRGRRNMRLAIFGAIGVLALSSVLCAGVVAGSYMMPAATGRNIPIPDPSLPPVDGVGDERVAQDGVAPVPIEDGGGEAGGEADGGGQGTDEAAEQATADPPDTPPEDDAPESGGGRSDGGQRVAGSGRNGGRRNGGGNGGGNRDGAAASNPGNSGSADPGGQGSDAGQASGGSEAGTAGKADPEKDPKGTKDSDDEWATWDDF